MLRRILTPHNRRNQNSSAARGNGEIEARGGGGRGGGGGGVGSSELGRTAAPVGGSREAARSEEQRRIDELNAIEEEEMQLAMALRQSQEESQRPQPPSSDEDAEKELFMALEMSRLECENKKLKEDKRPSASDARESPSVANVKAASDELSSYLDRQKWEAKARSLSATAAPDAPNGAAATLTVVTAVTPSMTEEKDVAADADETFLRHLDSSLEVFVNRMKSDSARGRSIAVDSSVQSLYMSLSQMHPKLLHIIQNLEEKRAHFEALQDKVTQLREAREALNQLSSEFAERRRREEAEAERKRQIMLAMKLENLRKRKQEMVEEQRLLSLQKLQQQEQEFLLKQQQLKQFYARQSVPPWGGLATPPRVVVVVRPTTVDTAAAASNAASSTATSTNDAAIVASTAAAPNASFPELNSTSLGVVERDSPPGYEYPPPYPNASNRLQSGTVSCGIPFQLQQQQQPQRREQMTQPPIAPPHQFLTTASFAVPTPTSASSNESGAIQFRETPQITSETSATILQVRPQPQLEQPRQPELRHPFPSIDSFTVPKPAAPSAKTSENNLSHFSETNPLTSQMSATNSLPKQPPPQPQQQQRAEQWQQQRQQFASQFPSTSAAATAAVATTENTTTMSVAENPAVVKGEEEEDCHVVEPLIRRTSSSFSYEQRAEQWQQQRQQLTSQFPATDLFADSAFVDAGLDQSSSAAALWR